MKLGTDGGYKLVAEPPLDKEYGCYSIVIISPNGTNSAAENFYLNIESLEQAVKLQEQVRKLVKKVRRLEAKREH